MEHASIGASRKLSPLPGRITEQRGTEVIVRRVTGIAQLHGWIAEFSGPSWSSFSSVAIDKRKVRLGSLKHQDCRPGE